MNESDAGIEKESIPFIPTYQLSNVKTLEIKFAISGSSFKTQLPIFREGSPEEFLNFLYEFSQAKTKLGYTTHSKLESGFEQLLQGNARNEWNTIKNTIQPSTNTVAAFNERVSVFKSLYISEPSAVDNQKNYLQRVRKNDKYTVPQFLDRLKHINMLLSQFPGASQTDCFSSTDVKKIFYHAMPVRWRTNFINSGQTLQGTSLDTLRTYMVQQELQTNAHRKKSRENNKEKQKSKPHTFNPRNRNQKRSPNQSKDNQSKDNKKRKVTNDDDCPIHGSSHKWGQCHQNQYGENFKPKRSSSVSGSQSSNRSQRSSYFNGPPPQVQIYSNESRPPPSDTSYDSRSLNSATSAPNQYRYPPGYPNNSHHENNNNNSGNYYQGQYVVETYANENKLQKDFLPEGSVLIQALNAVEVHLFGLGLFDSGSTTTLINKRSVPSCVSPMVGNAQAFTTTQGTYESSEYFMATKIFFPDFCKTRTIPEMCVRVFDSPNSKYDLILGRDVLMHGFILDHSKNVITWDGLTIPMQESTSTSNAVSTNFSCADTALAIYAATAKPILEAQYEKSLPQDVVRTCTHLSE